MNGLHVGTQVAALPGLSPRQIILGMPFFATHSLHMYTYYTPIGPSASAGMSERGGGGDSSSDSGGSNGDGGGGGGGSGSSNSNGGAAAVVGVGGTLEFFLDIESG